ncbi:MAG: NAD-dependent epimerase/dehydratase family protein [Acidobacteria bacterium]|nr:NAD-dependent epimerase/dehydratase family protein [Acidobacteriota bacterium]
MKILVTGGSGFVGGAIARRLAVSPGNRVIAAGRHWNEDPKGRDERFERVSFDVTDPATFEGVRNHGPFDSVVHAAALAHQFGGASFEQFKTVNVNGTENVCRLAAELGAQRFVLLSSVAVYGDHASASVTEGFECFPVDAYAETKLMSESVAADVFGRDSLLTLRLATVIGPGDAGNMARLITQIKRRRFVPVGSGDNLKTFVSVADVAEIVDQLVAIGATGLFNVAARPVAIRDVVGEICKALGRRPPRIYVPPAMLRSMFRINDRTLRAGAVSRAGVLLRKWLADDVYCAEALERVYGISARRAALDEIRAEVLSLDRQ